MISFSLLRCFFPLCLLLLGAEPGRIELKAGGPPVTLSGEIVKGKDAIYVFQAKAGLKFNGRITKKAGNTGFGVSDAGGDGLPEDEFDFNTSLTGTLEKGGDYKITVSTFETRPTPYTLVVRIY